MRLDLNNFYWRYYGYYHLISWVLHSLETLNLIRNRATDLYLVFSTISTLQEQQIYCVNMINVMLIEIF